MDKGSDAGLNATTGGGNVYIGAQVIGSDDDSNRTYIRNINAITVSGGGTGTVTVNLSTGVARSSQFLAPLQGSDQADG